MQLDPAVVGGDGERRADFVGLEAEDLAQQLLIFGTHVHIGIEDRDFLIDAANVAGRLPRGVVNRLCQKVATAG